jgi:hypothetical protein
LVLDWICSPRCGSNSRRTGVCLASLTYEDEEGRFQNKLEDWWITLDERRTASLSWAALFTFAAPPPTDGGDRECPRIMIRPNVHEPRVAPQVINAVWIGAGNVRCRKVVPIDLDRFLGGKPLPAVIFIVSEQLFFS